MHDVPQDLMDHIKELESQFTVDTAKLHEIVERFQSELVKGEPFEIPTLLEFQ
jgi:hexokinase